MKKNYRRLLPYGVALGTTAIALLLTFGLAPFLTQSIDVVFFGAITITTWYGGLGPGFVAIALSTLAVSHFFVPPEGQITDLTTSDIIRFVTFSLVGVVIHTLSSSLRASQRQVQQLSQHLLDESADRLKAALNEAQMNQTLLQQQFEQQRLVMEITQRIRQYLNLEDILQTTVDEVRELLQTDRVVIFRFFPDWRGIVAVESCGADWTKTLSTEINDPCFGENYIEPFKQGLVTAKADIYTAGIGECHLELLSHFQVRANLVVPIMKSTELWGLLIAHHCTAPRPWQDSEINLLRQIASQVGIALQQSALFEQVQAELIERRQVEVALKESQVQLQQQLAEIETIYQSAPIGLNVLDTDLRFVRINQRLAEMNGLPIEAHIGHTVRELLPDLADTSESLLHRVLETGKPLLNIEITGETPAQPGVQRTWIESFLPLKDSDTSGGQSQRIIGISSVCEEITERKQVEDALRQSEARLRLAQLASNSAVWDWDIQTNTFVWSLEYYQLCELDPSTKPTYENWLHCIHPDDREQVSQQTLQTLADKSSEVRVEFQAVRSDGVRWFAGIGQVMRDEVGQPTRMIGITIDITQQKQTEIALQELNAELEQRVIERTEELSTANDRLLIALAEQQRAKQAMEDLYNNAPCGYHSLNVEGTIVQINDTELSWLGYTRDEVLNQVKIVDLLTPETKPTFYQKFSQLLQQGSVNNFEFQLCHKDGSTRWVSVTSTAIKDEAGNFVMSRSSMFDISERKRAEDERKQAEQTLALQAVITRNMAEGICLVKADDATIVYANPKFEQMFGYGSGELNGQHVSIVNYPTESVTAEDVNQSIQSAVLKNGEATYEVHNVKKNGTSFWCSATCSVFKHPEYGTVLVAVHQDITEHKQAEATLQQQTRLEQLRWSITQSIRKSLNLNVILNTAVEQLRQTLQVDRAVVYQFNLDWSGNFIAESAGRGWVSLVDSDLQTAWNDTCLQKTQGGRFQHHETFVISDIYAADLHACHVEILEELQAKACAVVSIFSGTTLWGLLAVYQNTTVREWEAWEVELLQQIASQLAIAIQQSELYRQLQLELQERQQTEAVLREAERRWRSLLDNVQLIVVGLDIYGNVEYVNPFFLELSGYPLEEVLGKSWFNHFLSSSQRATTNLVFREVLEHNFHPHYQNPILTKLGEERMIAWSNTVLQDTEGKTIGTISIGEDITERYKVDRMKAEFISVVSHELRTPLTSMQAALSLLNEKIIDPLSEEGEVTIQIATEGTDRLARLVNDILDLERLESGKVRLEKHLYNIDDLVTTAVAQMQEMANQARITLEANPCHVQVTVDGDRLVQILTNLLSNAIKFSSQNSVVRLSVEQQELENNPSFLLFAVCDQGRGVPADKLESIFDRFHQVDASDSRAKGGTGLGLAICRSIVQQHGGEIWVESTVGQGSTFYFTIPMRIEGD